MKLCLEGVRVLEFSDGQAGPMAAMLLADLGAEVIKVEPPRGGSERYRYLPGAPEVGEHGFYPFNRNKQSVAVDLNDPRGCAVIGRLLSQADVVIDALRPGQLDACGLGYKTIAERNPGLIWCSLTPFGLTSPRRDEPVTEGCLQAISGLMSVTGEPAGPPQLTGFHVGTLIGDLYAAQAIVAALIARYQTRRGVLAEISSLDALMSLWSTTAARFLADGTVPGPSGNQNPNRAPSGPYLAADGSWIYIVAANDGLWSQLCAALGLSDLAADPDLATNPGRVARGKEINRRIAEVIATRPRAEWIKVLDAHGVPYGPVNDLPDVWVDPHFKARGMLQEVMVEGVGPVRFFGSPLRMPGAVQQVQPPPRLGQHTRTVLAAAGYRPVEISALAAANVITVQPS